MRILRRYISKNILSAIALVSLVLISLMLFVMLSAEFSDIGTGNYDTMHALTYVIMNLPANIYQFLPIAGLLGSLIGLSLLASRSELIVMRAAGVSIVKISSVVLQAALLFVIASVLLGEYLGPSLSRNATIYKTEAMSRGQTYKTLQGVWLKQKNNFIRIATILPGNQLKNITKYTFDQNQNLVAASFAKRASYHKNKWIFKDVTTSVFSKTQVRNMHFDTQAWNLKLRPHVLKIMKIDSSQRSLPQLYSYIQYLKYSGLQSYKPEFVFWQRVLQPLATLVMILLAIPFIFGPLRTVTMGLRIMTGTVIGLGYFILNQFLGPITQVFMLPPFLVAFVPTLLVAILGFILLLRAK